MRVKRGTAKNAATLQATGKIIELLESRQLLSGSASAMLAAHIAGHSWAEESTPVVAVDFGRAFAHALHSNRTTSSVHTLSRNDNVGRESGGDFGVSKSEWGQGASKGSLTSVIGDNSNTYNYGPYPISGDLDDNSLAGTTPSQGRFDSLPTSPWQSVWHGFTTPVAVTTDPYGGSPAATTLLTDKQKSDSPDKSGNTTGAPFHAGLLHPSQSDSGDHGNDEPSPNNPLPVVHPDIVPAMIHELSRGGSSTGAPTVLGPTVARANATNTNTAAANGGLIYAMPVASAPAAATSESRVLEVAGRGAKVDATASPVAIARNVVAGGAQYTFAFVADAELMARAISALLPQSMAMAELAATSDAAPVTRAGVEAAANVATIATSLAASKTMASAATAARAFFNIAPINATAMFSDALVSFANDFASLPQTPEPQTGSRRAWAITAAVIAIDGMLLGRWYLGRRKASKTTTLFRDGPAFA